MFNFVLIFHLMTHTWILEENKFWHISGSGEAPIDLSDGKCGLNMIHVKGNMAQDNNPNPYGNGTVEFLQKTTCTKWINKNFPERCASFDRNKWLKIKNTLSAKPMEFCIDAFEYPNRKGAYPWIFINWNESKGICEREGKRLCSEVEWTFACEGEEAIPYGYGYNRDKDICVIDKPYIAYRPSGMRNRKLSSNELDRLWQGEFSGSRPQCKSPFGVFDMTGSVDEWTSKVRPEGKYKSILKGGYFGRIRARCQPSTRGHNENHVFYQQGFRCCSR